MIIHPPCAITPRLRPGIQVAGAWFSIEYAGKDKRGANCFKWAVDVPGLGDFEGGSSAFGGLQRGLGDLCSFLDHAGNWFKITNDDPEWSEAHNPPFPQDLCEWAHNNSEAIQLAAYDLDRGGSLIEENAR